jgi:dihydropteroate synthase
MARSPDGDAAFWENPFSGSQKMTTKQQSKNKTFNFKSGSITCGQKTRLMGILNVTPDSFSDGGVFTDQNHAVSHAVNMIENGADIIDIGGESTRPGAPPVSLKNELKRVIPIISKLKSVVPESIISIDTTKPEVANAALSEGADIINDISGLQFSPEIADIAAKYNAGLILMHMRGTPATMKQLCSYNNLVLEICQFMENSADLAIARGVKKENIILDPGIGFAKNSNQNIEIIRSIAKFANLGYPLLVAPSRKSFIGEILNQPNPEKRIWGTAGAVAWLAMHNVDFIRIHDVREMNELLSVIEAINLQVSEK